MTTHVRKGVEFVSDPRILENQRKILQYIRDFQDEQHRIKQDVHMIMKETKHFHKNIYENMRSLSDNMNSVLDYVNELSETTGHMNSRLKSVYKYVKQMSSNQDALSSDTDSNLRPRRQSGRPARAKLKPPGLLHPDDKSMEGYSADSDTDLSQFSQPLTVSLPNTGTNRVNPTTLPSLYSTTWERRPHVYRPVPSGTSSPGDSTVSEAGSRSKSYSSQPSTQLKNLPQEHMNQPYQGKMVTVHQGVPNINVTPHLPIDGLTQQHLVQPALVKPNSSKAECANIAKQLGLKVSEETVLAMERAAKAESANRNRKGLHTVFIVDTSSSVQKGPMDAIKSFLHQVLDCIDDSSDKFSLVEYISIITFGKSTTILQPFIDTYANFRGVVENSLERLVGGRSSLLTALLTAFCYIETNGDAVTLRGHDIFPRIIIISDFVISNDSNLDENDSVSQEENNQVKQQLFKFMAVLKKRRYQTFCVPVGNYIEKNCIEIAQNGNGLVIYPENFEHAGFYYRYQIIVANCMNQYYLKKELNNIDDLVYQALVSAGLPPEHQDIVMEIIRLTINNDNSMDTLEDVEATNNSESWAGKTFQQAQHANSAILNNEAFSNEGQNNTIAIEDNLSHLPEWRVPKGTVNLSLEEMGRLPSLGSRVRKGKDWTWGTQDGHGPGTVVGHKSEGIVFVLWDNNSQLGAYRFGYQGEKYDVEMDKSPRQVEPGQIEIGCLVIRGNDWCRGDEDGGSGTVGAVIRKLPDRYVTVRWPSRVIETYKFGADDQWEVKVTSGKPMSGPQESQHPISVEPSTGPRESHVTPVEEEEQAVWKWQDDSKQWRIMSPEAINKLEQAFSKNPTGNVMVQNKGKNNKVYLDTLECEIGGTKRPITREIIKVSEALSLHALEDLMNDG